MKTKYLNDKLLNYVLYDSYDYIYKNRHFEATILNTYILENITVNSLLEKYPVDSNNYTIASNGRKIKIPSEYKLVRIPINVTLLSLEEKRYSINITNQIVSVNDNDLDKPETIYDRGQRKRRNIVVFINNKKVPDKVVWIYKSSIATDVFIPIHYFNRDKSNNIIINLVDYTTFPYISFYNKNYTGQSISIKKNECKTIVPTNINTLLYINGYLVPKEDYSVVNNTGINNGYSIILKSELSIPVNTNNYYEYELYLVQSITNKYNVYKIVNNYLYIIIPYESKELYEGPIVLPMCEFYVNGLKVSNIYMEKVTDRLFKSKNQMDNILRTENNVVEVILSDYDSTSIKLNKYISDFMLLSKLKSDQKYLNLISNKDLSDTYNPSWAIYDNPNFLKIDKLTIDSMEKRSSVDIRNHLYNLIRDNTHMIRSILRYFSNQYEVFTIGNSIGNVNIPLRIVIDDDSDDKYDENTRALYVYSDNYKIPDIMVNKTVSLKQDCIEIDKKYVKPNSKIKVLKQPILNKHMKFTKLNLNTIQNPFNNTYQYGKNDLGFINNINDIMLFKKVNIDDIDGCYTVPLGTENNPLKLFAKIIDRSSYNVELVSIDEEEYKTIKITLNNNDISATDELYIVNSCYYKSFYYKVEGEFDLNRTRLVLNEVDENGCVLPYVLGQYEIKVFVNGKLLLPGVDYVLNTPETIKNLLIGLIIFIRKINVGDEIEVINTGIDNNVNSNFIYVPSMNKYGFIYFEGLDIPFDPTYMDLYINDKLLDENDVEIFSDRLIRVKREYLPFYNIHLCTRFNVDISELKEFIDVYKSVNKPLDETIRNYCADYIFDGVVPTSTIPSSNIDFEQIYNEAPNYVDDTNKTPNPKRKISLPKRLFALLNKIAFDFKYGENRITKMINSNKKIDLNHIEYKILIDSISRKQGIITVDANDRYELYEDFVFDPNENYVRRGAILARVAHMIKNHFLKSTVDSNIVGGNNINPSVLLKTYHYTTELPPLDSNIDILIDNDIILDSNEGLSNNDPYLNLVSSYNGYILDAYLDNNILSILDNKKITILK